MKLPSLRDLTEDQRNVYLYAPTDRHVLVQGPPGTGKTLIACLRVTELQKRGVPVVLGMFNRVLMKYASDAAGTDGGRMPVQTIRSWFSEWWLQCGIPPHPDGGSICLHVPFEMRGEAREAGARWSPTAWRPWQQGTKGVWAVDYQMWVAAPRRFAAWRTYQAVPVHPDSSGEPDWDAVLKHLIINEEHVSDAALSLGALLIDEGQDFAPGFYKFLALIATLGDARGSRVPHPLRCFILADENQQLTEFNSTLGEIQKALKIANANRYMLLDNFRNSREIAELARSFFDDVSVLPRLPERQGERPIYSESTTIAECIQRIVTWVSNNPGKETGVLVFNDTKRAVLQQALTTAAAGIRGRKVKVQSYSWKSRATNPVSSLVFDQPDVITVLNMQSCKGLEFDAVFITDLHEASIGMYGPGKFRMQMFVAVSRAKTWVQLLTSRPCVNDTTFIRELPAEPVLQRELAGKAVGASSADMLAVITANEPAVEDWAEWASSFARLHGCDHEDLRPSGCFWIYATRELAPDLEKRGFRYTERRKGWWKI